MSAKNKLQKFAEMATFPNAIQPALEEIKEKDFRLKGKWHEEFSNRNPIVLELACGKGEYTVGLAAQYPEKNFIGIDIKGARMWKGAKYALENQLTNVRFLRTRIDFIESFFAKNEVDEIWITFPDPQPQKNRIRKRLTSPMFLRRYYNFLKPGGYINLKTDSDLLYEYTIEIIKQYQFPIVISNNNIYQTLDAFPAGIRQALEIKTFYEQMWLKEGKTIKFIRFSLNENIGK
ncbi:MAG: tRNA (guanosine(46)-N7)-methyltransferase TrmB [Bacteroidetes bacterium]|nr:MAG: tRNA (guanosine(46)-N7)-methyltransferase TrmB [Bacteroidota bacterium]